MGYVSCKRCVLTSARRINLTIQFRCIVCDVINACVSVTLAPTVSTDHTSLLMQPSLSLVNGRTHAYSMNCNFITHRSQEQNRLHNVRKDGEMKYEDPMLVFPAL